MSIQLDAANAGPDLPYSPHTHTHTLVLEHICSLRRSHTLMCHLHCPDTPIWEVDCIYFIRSPSFSLCTAPFPSNPVIFISRPLLLPNGLEIVHSLRQIAFDKCKEWLVSSCFKEKEGKLSKCCYRRLCPQRTEELGQTNGRLIFL